MQKNPLKYVLPMKKKKDVLLISPPISLEERYGARGKYSGGNFPPLGLAYIAACLEKEGFDIEIIDAHTLAMSNEDILQKIKEKEPTIIGFTSLTPTFSKVVLLSKKIKKFFPLIKIVVGGHHATIMQEKIINRYPTIDIVVFGEGEETMTELTRAIINKKNIHEIDGIVFREQNKAIKTKPRTLIKNLDNIPFPARHLLPMHLYNPAPQQYKELPVAHMIITRGCPFRCSFCSSSSVFGRQIRFPSPWRVVEEIKQIIKLYNVKEISFWDDTFTANQQWLDKFLNLLIEEQTEIRWWCYARVDTVNLRMLKKMKKAGCWNIFYGVESGNQKLLNNINKGITLKQCEDAVKWTKEAGIEVRASFIFCLPEENIKMAEETIDFAIALDPDYAQFSFATPYPGTELYKQAKHFGTLNKRLENFNVWSPVFLPWGYKNREEAIKIQKRAFRKFYIRPRYIFKRIKKIKSIKDFCRNVDGLKIALNFSKKK